MGIKYNLESNIIEKSRVMTEGKVIEKHFDTEELEYKDYYISYQYTALENGIRSLFKGERKVLYSTYESIELGQKIDVYYAASQPDISELTPGDIKQDALERYLMSAVMLGFLIMVLIVDSVREALGLGPIQ